MSTSATALPHLNSFFPLAAIPPLTTYRSDPNCHGVAIYNLGGTHMSDYARPLGLPIFKVGATGCSDAERRAEDCRRKQYASILKRPCDPPQAGRQLPNGHEWFLVPLSAEWLGNDPCPEGVTIADHVIRISVPITVTVQQVERALQQMMEPRSLHRYLDSAEGQNRLKCVGYDPAERFYTSYGLMGVTKRLSLAQELYLIKPKLEFRKFVRAVADLRAALIAGLSASVVSGGAL